MSTFDASQLPDDFSAVFGMGAPREFFQVKKVTRWGEVIAAVIFLGITGVVFLSGVYSAFTGMQQYGQVVFWERLTPMLVISFIAGGIGTLGTWSAIVNWRKALGIYENGLVYRDRTGIRNWRWDQMSQLYSAVTRHYTNGIYTGTTHLYTVHLTDGSKIKFDNKYAKVEVLGQALQQMSFKPLYDRAAAIYNSGQPVQFGQVILDKNQGLTLGKKNYPWSEVAQVSVERGSLRVAKKGGGLFSGANVMVATVPNLNVVLAMIDQIVGIKR